MIFAREVVIFQLPISGLSLQGDERARGKGDNQHQSDDTSSARTATCWQRRHGSTTRPYAPVHELFTHSATPKFANVISMMVPIS